MSSIEALSPSSIDAVAPPGSEASPPGDAAAPASGKRSAALFLATVLTLGAGGAWGYTQWWVPRQEAEQAAQVFYGRCIDEVKAYKGKHSYETRLSQCQQVSTVSWGG